ncbi:hypothetical protein SPE26_25455 [Bacillus thuringiensis]|uniref:T4 beta protein n=1 Tax=Bacillus thuringiensis TaxID=1428 RepID=A0AAW9GNC7_BACTU|nr:hypothetical protein [Bacillus thuringiensis]MDY0854060.1 hypothetical protein [Bacillus thuringiensis]MDY4394023.1 hypothetical protein [Bacillus thuringiensis]MDZ5479264.1 hypothetical protein [Bacillus thuringiensis]
MNYYPVIKFYYAEQEALHKVKTETKDHIIPIFESKRLTQKNIKKLSSNFKNIGGNIKKYWPNLFIYDFHSAFNDFKDIIQTPLLDNNTDIIQLINNSMVRESLSYIPCLHFDSPNWMIQSVSSLNMNALAIRIRFADVPPSIEDYIYKRVEELVINQFKNQEIYLLLDFQNKNFPIEQLSKSIKSFSAIPKSHLVFINTSCPTEAKDVDRMSFTEVTDRTDFNNYINLLKIHPTLSFGDYTIRLKDKPISFVPKQENLSLNIFYTSEEYYLIGRSSQNKDNGIKNFHQVCKQIISSKYYKGKTFSFGDNSIHECANNTIAISSFAETIKIGVNHHIELIVHQLRQF